MHVKFALSDQRQRKRHDDDDWHRRFMDRKVAIHKSETLFPLCFPFETAKLNYSIFTRNVDAVSTFGVCNSIRKHRVQQYCGAIERASRYPACALINRKRMHESSNVARASRGFTSVRNLAVRRVTFPPADGIARNIDAEGETRYLYRLARSSRRSEALPDRVRWNNAITGRAERRKNAESDQTLGAVYRRPIASPITRNVR